MSFRTGVVLCGALAAAVATSAPAAAQANAEREEPRGYLAITGRMWNPLVTTMQSANVGAMANFNDLYMNGGTIHWRPSLWNTSIMFTGLAGSDTGSFYDRPKGYDLLGKRKFDRVDVETLLRWDYGEKSAGAAQFAGVRYIDTKSTARGHDTFGQPFTMEDGLKVLLFQWGFQGTGVLMRDALWAGDSFNVSGGIKMGVGYRDGTSSLLCCGFVSETAPARGMAYAVDVDAGFSYVFSEAASAAFRYRAFYLADRVTKDTSWNTGVEMPIVHGPELSFTYTWHSSR